MTTIDKAVKDTKKSTLQSVDLKQKLKQKLFILKASRNASKK